METNWEPSEADLEWGRTLISYLNNDGIWMLPSTGMIMSFDKAKKRVFISGVNSEIEYSLRVKKMLLALGYTLIERLAA